MNKDEAWRATRETDVLDDLTPRDDRIGATARVMQALAEDEKPDESDLKAIGFPIPWEQEETLALAY